MAAACLAVTSAGWVLAAVEKGSTVLGTCWVGGGGGAGGRAFGAGGGRGRQRGRPPRGGARRPNPASRCPQRRFPGGGRSSPLPHQAARPAICRPAGGHPLAGAFGKACGCAG